MFQNDLSGLYRNNIPVTGTPWGQIGGYLGNTMPYPVGNHFGLTQIPCTFGHPAFAGQTPYGLGQTGFGNFGYFANVPVGQNWGSNLNTNIPFGGTFNHGTLPVNALGLYGHTPFMGSQWTPTPMGFLCR